MPPPMMPPMPVYYSMNGSNPMPVPSTGMFGSMGKQSTATSKADAISKANSSKLNLPPGYKDEGAIIQNNSFVVQYQNGGKRRKSRRGARSRRNKTRRKTRRSRK